MTTFLVDTVITLLLLMRVSNRGDTPMFMDFLVDVVVIASGMVYPQVSFLRNAILDHYRSIRLWVQNFTAMSSTVDVILRHMCHWI